MILLGLTGSIAMGKSRAAERFRAFGVPVFDSDAEVHALMAQGGAAVAAVAAAFPGCLAPGVGSIALARPHGAGAAGRAAPARGDHPSLGPRHRSAASCAAPVARRRARRPRHTAALRDRGERRVDAVAVVCASPMLQAQRALRRPGMTAERLARIRAEQRPDPWKRARADFVIPTGYDGGALTLHVATVIAALRGRAPRAWPPRPGHGG